MTARIEVFGEAQKSVKKCVSIYENGDFVTGKTLFLDPDWSLDDLLRAASQRLGMSSSQRVFNANAVEIIDCMMIEDDDILFISLGDDFIEPVTEGMQERNSQFAGDSSQENSKLPSMVGGYTVGKLLGKGGFGEVRVGEHHLTEEMVALKFMRKADIATIGAAERTITEVQCLTALKHQNIIKLYQTIETPSHVVLVFELMEGGDLMKYLRNRGTTAQECALTEDEARAPFHQVLSAVSYAHNQHICHRDLKLENLLLKSPSLDFVKVADFGLSDFYRPGSTQKTNCGTLSFLAPEVFKGTSNAGPPLDVWSLGVILFSLLCGRLPFEGPDLLGTKRPRDAVIRSRIIKSQFKLDDHLSAEAKDMVRRMLKVDPLERATIPEIFNHCWFRSINNSHELVRSRSSSRSYENAVNVGGTTPKMLTPRTPRTPRGGGISGEDVSGDFSLPRSRNESDEIAATIACGSKEKRAELTRTLSSERLAALAQSVASFELSSSSPPASSPLVIDSNSSGNGGGHGGVSGGMGGGSSATLAWSSCAASTAAAIAEGAAAVPSPTFKITPLRRSIASRNRDNDFADESELMSPSSNFSSNLSESPTNRSSPLVLPPDGGGGSGSGNGDSHSNMRRARGRSMINANTHSMVPTLSFTSGTFDAARSQSPQRGGLLGSSPSSTPAQFWNTGDEAHHHSPSISTSTTKSKFPLEKRNSTGSLKDSPTASAAAHAAGNSSSSPLGSQQRPLFSSPFLANTSAKLPPRKSLTLGNAVDTSDKGNSVPSAPQSSPSPSSSYTSSFYSPTTSLSEKSTRARRERLTDDKV